MNVYCGPRFFSSVRFIYSHVCVNINVKSPNSMRWLEKNKGLLNNRLLELKAEKNSEWRKGTAWPLEFTIRVS